MWKNRLRGQRVEQPAVSHLHTNESNQPEVKLPTIKVKDLADVGSASIPLQNETEMLQQPAGPLNIQSNQQGEVTQLPQGVWQQLRHALSQIQQSCASASQAATPLTVEERNESKLIYRNDAKFLFNLLLGQPWPAEQDI